MNVCTRYIVVQSVRISFALYSLIYLFVLFCILCLSLVALFSNHSKYYSKFYRYKCIKCYPFRITFNFILDDGHKHLVLVNVHRELVIECASVSVVVNSSNFFCVWQREEETTTRKKVPHIVLQIGYNTLMCSPIVNIQKLQKDQQSRKRQSLLTEIKVWVQYRISYVIHEITYSD